MTALLTNNNGGTSAKQLCQQYTWDAAIAFTRSIKDLVMQVAELQALADCMADQASWQQNLDLPSLCKPKTRFFNKLRVSKRHKDPHWRVFHGAVALNTFLFINTVKDSMCPFCGKRETVFHCFYDCHHLLPLFCLFWFQQTVFNKCR